jgi:hypothetical protein
MLKNHLDLGPFRKASSSMSCHEFSYQLSTDTIVSHLIFQSPENQSGLQFPEGRSVVVVVAGSMAVMNHCSR